MKIPLPSLLTSLLKRLVPESLFGRALLILLVPVLFVQIVAMYVFFTRHMDSVTLYLSRSLAGEVAIMAGQAEHADTKMRAEIADIAKQLLGIMVRFEPASRWVQLHDSKDARLDEFIRQLHARLHKPFKVDTVDNDIAVYIRIPGEVLVMQTSIKRLSGSAPYMFVGWMITAGVIFLIIATLFLRGQVRPVVTLARAANRFGRGEESPHFRPQGAREVRLAGQAFLTMQERIQRLLRTRVDMLAGISHDLRTPIARMKLQLAMMGQSAEVEGMQADLAQMEQMIAEYLDFVRGAGGEEVQPTNLNALLQEIAEDYRRMGKTVFLSVPSEIILPIRPNAFRRAITNLMDNALRHGTRCAIVTSKQGGIAHILLDDDGPGIAPADREAVFQPFRRLDVSRNLEEGGVGLGLTIVRDIIHAHGGEIALDQAPIGGLRVSIFLPM